MKELALKLLEELAATSACRTVPFRPLVQIVPVEAHHVPR